MKTYRTRADRARDWNAQAFEDARYAAGLSFRDIAEGIGVSVSTAHRWAQGFAPAATLVPAIAKALKVPQRRLLR